MNPSRILRLTLKKKWFDMVVSGVKREEYREQSDWILSRLRGKHYDAVEFSNGYGPNVPKVVVKFQGWTIGWGNPDWGAMPDKRYALIYLGDIISSNVCDVPCESARPSTEIETL